VRRQTSAADTLQVKGRFRAACRLTSCFAQSYLAPALHALLALYLWLVIG
jgi:hypothetical protein